MPALGADPEFVIVNSHGVPVPAHRFFGGKDAKHIAPGGMFFRDGYMVEINPHPSACRVSLGVNVGLILADILRQLPSGYGLSTTPAIPVDLKDIANAPFDVQEFGCDPSYDAYTAERKTIELDGTSHPYRYAGGHMHFSWGSYVDWPKSAERAAEAIRALDLYVGVPMSYVFDRPEQYLRRRYYGQAGEFRLQTYPSGAYGIEYRTPGPELWNHNALYSMFFGVARNILYYYGTPGGHKISPPKTMWDDIRGAINEGVGLEKLLQLMPKAPDDYYSMGIIADDYKMLRDMRLFDFDYLNPAKLNLDRNMGWAYYSPLFRDNFVQKKAA